MTKSTKKVKAGIKACEEWNSKHSPGTPVRYWPVMPPIEGMPPVDTETRSEAWLLGDGSPVVLLVGKTGGCNLSHLKIREPE